MDRQQTNVNTLIITGNGFDLWQGLDTSYAGFREFYLEHRDEIVENLGYTMYEVEEEDGIHEISAVELICGDPFGYDSVEPGRDYDSWHEFEEYMDRADEAVIEAFFGEDYEEGEDELQDTVAEAMEILTEVFRRWLDALEISEEDSGYVFGEDTFCINFNYTDTIQKRFHPEEGHVSYIHGTLLEDEDDEDQWIICGHASHPQSPIEEFDEPGGRFRSLYLLEQVLYETDKHAHDNIQFLRVDMEDVVRLDEVTDIYVLGHSFGETDDEYFRYLHNETSVYGTHHRVPKREVPVETEEELRLRMQYAIHLYEEGTPVSEEEMEATERRLEYEYARSEEEILSNFDEICPNIKEERPCLTDARWHISYDTEEDKERIVETMERIGCENYELYGSIEECLERFDTYTVKSRDSKGHGTASRRGHGDKSASGKLSKDNGGKSLAGKLFGRFKK